MKTILPGLLMFASTGLAGDLSLTSALAVAVDKNISIKQAINNTRISTNTASLANAGLLPRLDLSTGTNFTDATNQTLAGETTVSSTRNSAGLNASYTVFKGLQGINSYKILKSQASAAELQEILTRENILMATAQSYFAVLMNFDNLSILKSQMDISRERLARALDKNARGMSSSLQALAAQVDFDTDSASVLEAEYVYAESRRNLNLLLGWDINEAYEPVGVDREFGNYLYTEIEAQGISMNTAYLLSQVQEEQMDLSVNSTLGSVLPIISLSGSYGLQQINQDFDLALDNPDLSLSGGLTLTWNLFDGRKVKSLQSAKIQKKNSELSTLASKRSVIKELETAHSSYIKSLRVLELKQTNLASAQLNFEQNREFYNLGQVSATQFRDSQLNLSRVRSSLSQARYTAYLDEMRIWQLTGQLPQRI